MKSLCLSNMAQPFNLRAFALGVFLLVLSSQHLRAQVGGDNPTGVTGAFNGQITTGCSYDAYTGNATRSCTDITVTSVGAYPLALVRTANSRGKGVAITFGLAGHWNHSYNWIVEDSASSTNQNFQPSSYTADFPDGRVETFKQVNWDSNYRLIGANGAPLGVRERFVPINPQNNPILGYLILPDGGKVEFVATRKSFQKSGITYYYYSYVAQAIIDPYTLRTNFAYNPDGTLLKVTEPGGRYLQFTYTTVGSTKVIQNVTEVINGINRRSVQYNYMSISPGGQEYTALDNVVYYGTSQWTAHYHYSVPNVLPTTGVPLLSNCDDPMYSGPMHKIAYVYKTGTNQDGTPAVYGQIQSENYYDGTVGPAVSTLAVTGTSTRQETRGEGKTRTFTYGTGADSGFLMSWTDFMNYTARQTYDDKKYINSVTDRRGNRTDYTLDPHTGLITQIQYPLTPSDTEPQQTQRSTANYTYESDYYLHTSQDEAANITTYIRDGTTHRITQVNYPDGGYETFTYDGNPYGLVHQHRMTTGGTETFIYGARGLKQTYRNPDTAATQNPTAQYQYDDYDRVSGMTTVLGQSLGDPNATTSYTYNLRGQVLTTTFPLDTFTNERRNITNVYNPNGDGTLQSKTDHFNHADHTTTYTFDDYRRLKSMTLPDRGDGSGSHTTSYFYDANGTGDDYRLADSNVTWVTLPSTTKRIKTDYYDSRLKWKVTVAPSTLDAATTSYEYDNVGNVTKVIAPNQQPGQQYDGKSTQTDYDERNRPWRITDALNHITTITYDQFGRKKKITHPNQQTVTYDDFDQMNRVKQQTATNAGTTKYAYYPGSGLLHTMQDPRLVATQSSEQYEYVYDLMARKTSARYPHDSGGVQTVESFVYDTCNTGPGLGTGTLYQFTNRKGNKQTFAYDGLNRMVAFSWDDGVTPSTLFSYDGASRLTDINNSSATVHRAYFNDNLLQSETENITLSSGTSKTVNYGYDADGNRATLQYPSNSYSFTYLYTGRNQLQYIFSGNTPLATYGYNPNGDMISRNLQPRGSSSYTYDELDRVKHIEHLFSGAPRTLDYDYDTVGNRKWAKHEDGYGDVFGYDLNDQVTAVLLDIQNPDTTSVGDQTIFYDGSGNRTVFRPYDYQDAYAVNDLNQYTTRTESDNPLRPTPTPRPPPSPTPRPTPPGQQAAAYDYAGNMTTGFDGSTYVYDAQNRLLSATNGGATLLFAYDGLNRQVSRTVTSNFSPETGTTFSVWDGWDLLMEYRADGTTTAAYLNGPSGLVKNLTSGNIYFQDGSGSTSLLTDSAGNLLEWYRYDLQGMPIFYDANNNQRISSAYNIRHLFTGQQWYGEVGLYDLRNRFYSPNIGRFLQPDPSGFNGDATNLYRYCGNNPVTPSDPTGLANGAGQTQYVDGRGFSPLEFKSWLAERNEEGPSRPSDYWGVGATRADGVSGTQIYGTDGLIVPGLGLITTLNWLGIQISPDGTPVLRARPVLNTASGDGNPLGLIGDILGKILNIPNDIIGLGAALLSGAQFDGFGNNALQFTGGNLPSWMQAITIGNIQIYNSGYYPESYGYSPYTPGFQMYLGFHEQGHTYQWQVFGPLFIPLYFGSKLFGNPFETGADQWAASHQPPPPPRW